MSRPKSSYLKTVSPFESFCDTSSPYELYLYSIVPMSGSIIFVLFPNLSYSMLMVVRGPVTSVQFPSMSYLKVTLPPLASTLFMRLPFRSYVLTNAWFSGSVTVVVSPLYVVDVEPSPARVSFTTRPAASYSIVFQTAVSPLKYGTDVPVTCPLLLYLTSSYIILPLNPEVTLRKVLPRLSKNSHRVGMPVASCFI